MKTFELQEGLLAMLEEVLAVTTEQIAEDQMTLPDELADLIRVETFADQGNLTDTGLVLRFKGGAEFQISIVRSE